MLDGTVTWCVLPLFFLVAMLFAGVGHGGASGYLALFALLGAAQPSIVPLALVLNILVATLSFVVYLRSGLFSLPLLLPFVISSIPAAYVGGRIPLSSTAFTIALGSALFLAGFRMLFLREAQAPAAAPPARQRWPAGVLIGSALGLIAGMVGIGGGVFLSPILIVLNWADVKRTAAISSAFIVLNSLSALAGHLSRGSVALESMVLLGPTVLAGGLVGATLGARYIRPPHLQILLGIVLLIAGGKLLVPILL